MYVLTERTHEPSRARGVPWRGVSRRGLTPQDIEARKFIMKRMEEAKYEEAMQKQGVPWPIRKMLSSFTAQRDVQKDAEGKLMFKSKMLTGQWTGAIYPDKEEVFELLGYKIVTMVTWEDTPNCPALVSTSRTTADAGMLTAAVDVTTRIIHRINADGNLEIETVAPEGTYIMWMVKKA